MKTTPIENLSAWVIDSKGNSVRLVPEANFTLPKTDAEIQWEQAGETWLGRRIDDHLNDDMSPEGKLFAILNSALSSAEVDWKRHNADSGKIPLTCEWAAIVLALREAINITREEVL